LNPIFVQAGAYGAIIVLSIFVFSFLFRGFFWKYIRVRASQGSKFLVKLRNSVRDHFAVGEVKDGFLIYTLDGQTARLSLNEANSGGADPFYWSMAVRWIDVNEATGAICKVNYEPVSGFDPKHFDDLNTRCLQKPIIGMDAQKMTLFIVIGLGVLVAVLAFMTYKNGSAINALTAMIKTLIETKGVVTATGGVI
jgi:hypothetical protein